jgi:hypothetical protein
VFCQVTDHPTATARPLARLRNGGPDLAVQEVRRGDTDRGDLRIRDDVVPIDRGSLEAELVDDVLRPSGHVVGHGHRHHGHREVREVVRHAGVGLGVDAAHPAETDHGDADGRALAHGCAEPAGCGMLGPPP